MKRAATIALLLGAGCSLLTTAAPPSPRCNTSRLSPLIDTTIGVLAASAAAYYVSREEVGASVTTGATAALFGTSAIVGWSRTSRCAAAGSPRGKVVVTTSDECGLVLDQVYFERGTASMLEHQRPVLDETAAMFRCMHRTGEVTRWQVVGATDATEPDPAALSLSRARAVADALLARGVDAATLDVSGVGAAEPQDPADTPQAHAKNRRVFFLVLERRTGSP